MSEQLAILKTPRLAVDDRDYVTLRFDAKLEGRAALQVIYLEGPNAEPDRIADLIRAAGSYERLQGLPIIVYRDDERRTMHYVRPADV